MELYEKVQDIKTSRTNGANRQAFSQLKEVNNDESYSMVDVLKSIALTDQNLASRLAYQLIEEAY